MSIWKNGFDILYFADILPRRFRSRFYRSFWRWRYRVNNELARSKVNLREYDSAWYALEFTAKESLEAAITDIWRRHCFDQNISDSRRKHKSWSYRITRLPICTETLVSCVDKLLRHPLAECNRPALFRSLEESIHYSLTCLISGERGSERNPHLRWSDPAMAGRVMAVDSNLRVPYVELMVLNPEVTYEHTLTFLGSIKAEINYSAGREVVIALLEGLLNDCLRWWKIKSDEELPDLPVIDIDDCYYLLKSYEACTSVGGAAELLEQSRVLSHLRRYIRAFRVIDRAVQIDPTNIDLWIHRSLVLEKIDSPDFDLIEKESMELAAQNIGDNSEANYELGNHFLYSQPPDYEKAITFYSKAIELDPNLSEAICNRGVAYLNLDLKENALADFDRVIEVNPADKFAYINKARIFYSEEKYDESFSQLENVLALDSSHEFAIYMKALIYLQRDQYDLCLSHCDLALKINSKYRDALYLRNRLKNDFHQKDCIAKSNGEEWIADVAYRCGRYSGGFDEFSRVLEEAEKVDALKDQASSFLLDLKSRGEQGDGWWDEVSQCFHEWMDIKIKLLKDQPLLQEQRRESALPMPSFISNPEMAGPRDAKSISEGYLNRLEKISSEFWENVNFKDTFLSPPKELRTEVKDYSRWHVSWFHPVGDGRSHDIHDLLSESSHYYLEADGKLFCCDHFKWFDLNYLEDNIDLCSLTIKEVLGDFDDTKARKFILNQWDALS